MESQLEKCQLALLNLKLYLQVYQITAHPRAQQIEPLPLLDSQKEALRSCLEFAKTNYSIVFAGETDPRLEEASLLIKEFEAFENAKRVDAASKALDQT